MGFKSTIFIIFVSIFIVLSIQPALGAVISGSIYDLSLNKESDVIVEINTIPKQILVSKNGEYAFNVKSGTYDLYAHTETSEANETVVVNQDDGEFIIDIILEERINYYQDFNFNDDITPSAEIPSETEKSDMSWIIVIMIILVILVFAIGMILFFRAKNFGKSRVLPEVKDEYEHKIITLLKKEKRVTQKDLRKEIPLSEAKISLIITDLESKGKIRKIKKGRGNILVFVKE